MKNQTSAPCKEILPKELRKPGGRHDSLPAARPAAFTAQGKLVLKEGELDITTAPAPAQIPAAEWVTLVMLEAEVTTLVWVFLHFKMNLLTGKNKVEGCHEQRDTGEPHSAAPTIASLLKWFILFQKPDTSSGAVSSF